MLGKNKIMNNMKEFIWKRKKFEFWHLTGEVLGSNKSSETHVSASGGGGYISQNFINLNPISVDSTVITKHEFWVKTNDGTEHAVKLQGVDVPLRAGQRVSVISAGRKGKGHGFYSILVNHSAGKYWFISDAKLLNRQLKIEVITGKSIVLAVLAWYVIHSIPPSYFPNGYSIFENARLAVLLPTAFVLYRMINKLISIPILRLKLGRHLKSLAQFSFANL